MHMFFKKLSKVWLYKVSFALRPYEQAVLDAWRKHLSPDGNTVLAAQLQYRCTYQRLALDKELSFFPFEQPPYPELAPDMLFPCRLESCVVARIHIAGVDKQSSQNILRAEIILHEGEISSIKFNQPPAKKLANAVKVTKVEILRDPMILASEETRSDAQQREEVLKTIQSKLPEEYLQLARNGKGVEINEWEVFAVQDIWKTSRDGGNYYLLAEKEGMGTVGIKEDEWSSQLYYLDYDDSGEEKITVSLRKFFEEFDGGKVVGRF